MSGWESLEVVANLTISLAYLCIGVLITVPLVRQRQLGNKLAVATAAIFFSCSAGHFAHFLMPLLGAEDMAGMPGMTRGASGSMGTWWTAVIHALTACVAIYYLSLRRFYGRLLTVPMFDDLAEKQRLSELEAFRELNVARAEAEGERDFAVALMNAISQNSPALIYVKNLDGQYLMVNQAFEQTMGVSSADVIGQTSEAIGLEADDRPEALRHERSHPVRQTTSRMVGTVHRHFETTRFPVLTTAGEVCATCGVTVDVTDWRRVNDELAAARDDATRARDEALSINAALAVARDEALAATAAKSTFLATMSHEIRTPLNGVIGYADLLLEQPELGPTALQYGERIQSAGSALLTVVNDILDFSKVEAGEIALHPDAFPLAGLIDNTASIVRASAERKGVALAITVDPAAPAEFLGDQNRLRQVLLNLLNNAVKFTASGSVRLSVAAVAQASDEVRLRFAVQDTGIGIPAAKRHLLFERFSQVDGSIQREFGGTGLGLAISKRLVNLMRGEIGVESEEGRGSTFWFEVPLRVAQPTVLPQAHVLDRSERRSCRLLLVEDVPLNQELACAILRRGGHAVDVASSGSEAIQAVQATDYDLVLMDVQMPIMDGLTATRHIRALEHPNASVPIIALTANVLPQQVSEFRAAGMNDHVGKPFKQQPLFAAIERWARKPDSVPPPAPSNSTALDRATFAEVADSLGPDATRRLLAHLAEELEPFPVR